MLPEELLLMGAMEGLVAEVALVAVGLLMVEQEIPLL
jgi:hypothetical protein